ncbi:MAG TPA: hypothetical protein VG326_10310 [Tepidisphaeraceae bacterium]|jgi:hypothetical protein|nr:hypothetical protein [Tepidisphaeraceae bacterium]
MSKSKPKKLTGLAFEKLSAAEKERIYRAIDASPPEKLWAESKPPTVGDRKRFARVAKKMGGRPKVGKGSKVVSISVEADLLKSADAYAKRLGIGRTELFVHGLRAVMAGRLPAPFKSTGLAG